VDALGYPDGIHRVLHLLLPKESEDEIAAGNFSVSAHFPP
jgi:hypothetical protein